jgi:hypothetical protein
VAVAGKKLLAGPVISRGAAADQFVSVGRSRGHVVRTLLRLTCGIVARGYSKNAVGGRIFRSAAGTADTGESYGGRNCDNLRGEGLVTGGAVVAVDLVYRFASARHPAGAKR